MKKKTENKYSSEDYELLRLRISALEKEVSKLKLKVGMVEDLKFDTSSLPTIECSMQEAPKAGCYCKMCESARAAKQ